MKLLVISICKDEAKTIGELLDRIPAKIPGVTSVEKWIIDDGSTDDTVAIAEKHGARTLHDGVQKRLGLRFRQAVDLALQRGADLLVNIDGDMQFRPEEIPDLLQPILEGRADFVAADRFTDPKTARKRRPKYMAPSKYWANKLGTKILGWLSGQQFSDVTCGFRAYTRDTLYALNLHGAYTYTQESFQVLAMKRFRIQAVPVSIKYYPGRKSRVVRSFWQFLFGSAINILRAFRDYAPLRFFGNLGNAFFVLGLACLIFTLIHWIDAGQFSPYKVVGFAGLYFVTLAVFVWIIGLVADMFDRVLNNQERIIESLKRDRYDKK